MGTVAARDARPLEQTRAEPTLYASTSLGQSLRRSFRMSHRLTGVPGTEAELRMRLSNGHVARQTTAQDLVERANFRVDPEGLCADPATVDRPRDPAGLGAISWKSPG